MFFLRNVLYFIKLERDTSQDSNADNLYSQNLDYMIILFCEKASLSFEPRVQFLLFPLQNQNKINYPMRINFFYHFWVNIIDSIFESDPFPLLVWKITFFFILFHWINLILFNYEECFHLFSEIWFMIKNKKGILV